MNSQSPTPVTSFLQQCCVLLQRAPPPGYWMFKDLSLGGTFSFKPPQWRQGKDLKEAAVSLPQSYVSATWPQRVTRSQTHGT